MVSIARQSFHQAISAPDHAINLAAAALYLAQEEYPDLDVASYLGQLDRMAVELQETLPPERYPLRVVQAINYYLYDRLGFVGNTTDYYDPRNSFLNDVLERHTGIPITLSLVYLEIANRIDFPMNGVGMPGHFLIRPDIEDVELYVDAFQGGQILFAEDCQLRLQALYGQTIAPEKLASFLPRVSSKHLLARMLTNLKMIYLHQRELEKALAAVDRILLLFPEALLERRDRGVLLYYLNQWYDSRQDLETYLAAFPTAEDRASIQQLLDQMYGI